MPRLFVLGGRDVGRSFSVEEGGVIGRAPESAARLGDRSVSRRHARIELLGGRWWVVDLGSQNGVRKGGKRVRRAPLADHDEFHVGDVPMRFRLGAGAPARAPTGPAAEPKPPEPDRGIELEETIHLERASVRPAPSGEADGAQDAGSLLRGGILTGDLAQRPLLVRALLIGFVIALAAGSMLAAFLLVRSLRAPV